MMNFEEVKKMADEIRKEFDNLDENGKGKILLEIATSDAFAKYNAEEKELIVSVLCGDSKG